MVITGSIPKDFSQSCLTQATWLICMKKSLANSKMPWSTKCCHYLQIMHMWSSIPSMIALNSLTNYMLKSNFHLSFFFLEQHIIWFKIFSLCLYRHLHLCAYLHLYKISDKWYHRIDRSGIEVDHWTESYSLLGQIDNIQLVILISRYSFKRRKS